MEPNIQTTILRNLINDEDYTRSVIPFLKKEYFENNHRVVFDSVVEFVDKYNKLPTQEALSIELTTISPAPSKVHFFAKSIALNPVLFKPLCVYN